MKINLSIVTTTLFLFVAFNSLAQNSNDAQAFWNNLQKHCGKAYEGTIEEQPNAGTFKNQVLVMHVRACNENQIRIPFFVGNDRSRTWVLTLKENRITLKHDHRHADGTSDKQTNYGGTSTHTGSGIMQIFPADQETINLIPGAIGNVWWITLEENKFTYNLRRLGTDRLITVTFDLTKEVLAPEAPWGWKD